MQQQDPQRSSFLVRFLFLTALAVVAGRSWQRDRSAGAACETACGFGLHLALNGEAGTVEPVGLSDESHLPETDFAAVGAALMQVLPEAHLLRGPFDADKSARAWTNFLSSLDYEHVYFRQEDIDAFEPRRLVLGDELRSGDVSFASEVYSVYLRRIEERVLWVEELLKTPFDFSIEESFLWKRKDAPWPASLEEQNEVWRLRVKNEVLARTIAQERKEEEKAKTKAQEAAGDTVVENAPPEKDPVEAVAVEDGKVAEEETPEQFILKRYHRFLTTLQDNDAEDPMSRYLGAVAMAFDPHTGYLSPVSLEDFGINMQLSLQGIGAQLRPEDGTARIVEIIPGGPADRDTREIRLVPGDRIVGVGQGEDAIVDTLHWPLYKTVRQIRGAKGTKVVLLVQSASDPTGSTTRLVDLVRDEVELEEQAAISSIETVNDAQGNPRKLGVVRLPTFYSSMGSGDVTPRSASMDIAKLLAEINGESVEGLVLDLRGNGGGALKEAIDLVGLFIRTGPVVLVKDRVRIHTLPDQDPAVAFRKPVVVLIDRISASASEIVAGALQDYGRAIVVGDSRTHGKGTVQQILGLDEDGSLGSIKVTNASFYRINGSSTQSRGVSCDILVPSAYDFFADLGEDTLPYAIPWSSVQSSTFRPVATLGPTINALRERSEARLKSDERWQRHARRMKRIESVQNLARVPLQIEQRRAFAQEEQALEDLENGLLDEDSSRKEREAAIRARDVVLDEGLRILIDFIDVHGPILSLQQTASQPGMDSLFDRFFR